ncbi:MAG: transposase [Janthinobacterium lividum]
MLNTPRNYTGTYLAAHSPTVSHDQVYRFLRGNRFSASQLRKLVQPLLTDSPEAFLLVDDSVQDKRYSRFIDLAKRQYSGATPGMVMGIGLVNLVHSRGEAGDFLPLDFRIYAPQQDGLTKNNHFQAMFKQVVAAGNIQARTLLFDSWYASSEHLKVIHRADWTFFTTLKSNRLVSLNKETGYQALDTLEPPAQGWSRGVAVRLQQVPFALKLFK